MPLKAGWEVGPGGGNMVKNTATGQVVDTNHPVYMNAPDGAMSGGDPSPTPTGPDLWRSRDPGPLADGAPGLFQPGDPAIMTSRDPGGQPDGTMQYGDPGAGAGAFSYHNPGQEGGTFNYGDPGAGGGTFNYGDPGGQAALWHSGQLPPGMKDLGNNFVQLANGQQVDRNHPLFADAMRNQNAGAWAAYAQAYGGGQ